MRGRREAARTQNASDDPFLLPISPPGDGARDHTGRAAKGKGGSSVSITLRARLRLAATYRARRKSRYLPSLYLVLTALNCGGFCEPEPSWGRRAEGTVHDRQTRFGHPWHCVGGGRPGDGGECRGTAGHRRPARLAD